MALDQVFTFEDGPIQLGSSGLAIHWGAGAPSGSTAPFSDMAVSSLYFQTDATADTGHWWQKVDNAGSADDWAKAIVNFSEEAYTLEAALTLAADTRLYFRDTGLYIYSSADGTLNIVSDGNVRISSFTKRISFPIAVGGGTADIATFNGAGAIRLNADTETFYYQGRVPDAWDGASDITVWFDVGNGIAEDDGDDVSLTLQVRGYADGEAMSDAGQSVSALLNLTGGDEAINVINRVTGTIDYDDGTYPIAANDTLVIEATVNLGGAGECTGPLYVVAWGIEFTADRLGA